MSIGLVVCLCILAISLSLYVFSKIVLNFAKIDDAVDKIEYERLKEKFNDR